MNEEKRQDSHEPQPMVGAESPLRVAVEGDELVIRIGVNRLNGNDGHPEIPEMEIENRDQWVEDVIRELNNEDEKGGSPLIYLLDRCIIAALEQGSTGIAKDSPTHVGQCAKCEEDCVAVRYTKDGDVCNACRANARS